MSMIEVKTAELIGPALDWAVAKALGWNMVRVPSDIDGNNGGEVLAPPYFTNDFKFPPRGAVGQGFFLRRWSTDWSHGGPLIDRHICELVRDQEGYSEPEEPWYASCDVFWQIGQTPLIAACRAIVAAKFGDAVSVPAELVAP